MGACDFEEVGYGKTAEEAFRDAVAHAQYEHGHGGYSGTIAEKHGFVLVKPSKEEAVTMLKKEIEAFKKKPEFYANSHGQRLEEKLKKIEAMEEIKARDFAYVMQEASDSTTSGVRHVVSRWVRQQSGRS